MIENPRQPRSTSYNRSQPNVQGRPRRSNFITNRKVSGDLERQWELKFSEFVAHMQGSLSAYEQEASTR